MKVLHIFNSLMPSGAETMWHSAAEVLNQEGIETHVLATHVDLGPYAREMRAVGYRVHHIPHKSSAAYFDFNYCRKLFLFLRQEKFDAVQVHPDGWRFTNVVVARISGVKKVTTTIHSCFEKSLSRRLRRPICMRLMQMMGCKIISIGTSVDRCERSYHYTPILIWNWFNYKRFASAECAVTRIELGIPKSAKLMISVGNCSEVKNHKFLFAVMARWLPDDYFLLHVGREDPSLGERELVEQLGISERVRFLGKRDDVPSLLSMSDVYVMPSKHEGFSIACLEAVAIGLKTVVADVPGLRDLTELVPLCFKAPLDEKVFADKIIEVMGMTEELRRELAEKTRVVIKECFSMEANVKKYIDLWK